jgi:hypothetical protein
VTRTYPKTSQIEHEAALTAIGTIGATPVDTIVSYIEQNTQHPLRIFAANTPDSKLYFAANIVKNSVGSDRVSDFNKDSSSSFVDSWIDFQAKTTSSAAIAITFPASTIGYYRRCAFWMLRDGTISAQFTPETNIFGSLADPFSTYIVGGILKGYVDLECTDASGKFKTIASTTDVIENSVSTISRIHEITDESKLVNHGNVDPSVTSTLGFIGEILEQTDAAQLWLKQDSGSTTNWKLLDWSLLKTGYSGWASASGVVISFSGLNNETVNITGTRTFYVQGRPFKKTTTESLTMSGSAGVRFFSYNASGVLQQSTSSFDFVTQAPVAVAYWTGTTGHSLGWEMHGLTDAADHAWKHLTVGTRYISGYSQTSTPLAAGNPASDVNSFIWFTGGDLFDEDIRVTTVNTLTPTNKWDQNLGTGLLTSNAAVIPFLYVNASSIATYVPPNATRFPFIFTGANGLPEYDNAGVLTATPSGNFAVYWFFGTSTQIMSDVNFTTVGTSVYARPHNATFTSLVNARTADFSTLNWSAMSVQENKALYRVIIQCNNAYTNATHRCKIVEIADYRNVSAVPVGGVSANDHLLLTNLNGGQYGDGNHQNLAQIASFAATPTVADDLVNYKNLTMWLNTNIKEAFLCTDNSSGAASWRQIVLNGGNNASGNLTIGTNGSGGDVIFRTAGTSEIARMKANQGTNFCIGLTTPTAMLCVGGNFSTIFTIPNPLSTSIAAHAGYSCIEIASTCVVDVTVDLQNAPGKNGAEYTIRKRNSDAYKVTVISSNAGDTIEGLSSFIFNTTNEVYKFKSDGIQNWRIV